MEVCRQDTPLVSRSWRHEEIKDFVFSTGTRLLNESTVDDAAIGRIHETALLVFHEEALGDPLVHDDQCDLWVLHLVVELVDSLLELRNLPAEAEVTLCITQAISIDDEVGRVVSTVLRSKDFNGILDAFLHLSLDDLLSFLLDNELRVVLAHLSIGRSSNADDRVWSRMADINTNEHVTLCLHDVRELHVVKISSNLTVHLFDHVSGLRQIERLAITTGHYLGWQAELIEEFLDVWIVHLTTDHCQTYGWMSELAILRIHHVLVESESELVSVAFVF